VFAGATETLPLVRYIYTECHGRELYAGQPTLDELKAILADFEIVGEYTDNYLFRRKNAA
jgi:hypothetical protein